MGMGVWEGEVWKFGKMRCGMGMGALEDEVWGGNWRLGR